MRARRTSSRTTAAGSWPCSPLMLAGSVVGAIVALYTDGMSFSLVFGAIFSLLFWYWIAMGAWRRTSWSSRP